MNENFLMHVGVAHDSNPPGRGSGRYGYGTGENPNQHMENKSLAEQKAALAQKYPGITEKEIAIRLGYANTTALRDAIQIQKAEKMHERDAKIHELYSKGITSPTEIEKLTGIKESTVRQVLKASKESRLEERTRIKDELKGLVSKDGYIDVGKGSEIALGISETKKNAILRELEEEGYSLHNVQIEQLGTQFKTTMQVLCPPGTDKQKLYSDMYEDKTVVKPIGNFIEEPDGTRSVLGLPPVNSVSLDRVYIRYPEEGGAEKDGTIELKRGSEDISLGDARYAQVRIGVDGKYYLKGMALYGDDKEFPPGKDIIFNTSKSSDLPVGEVLKKMKTIKGTDEIDQDNPFGATVKREDELRLARRYYIDPDTGEKKVSAINVVNEEGDWGKWSKSLSSQFLSKQPLPLINQQLNLAYLKKADELADIKSIENDSVKRVMLMDFADKCDSAAVDLKAAALPRQQSHVILPLSTIKDNQIYAPNYEHGEEVILVRYPHGGTFEIPRLTVNNKNKEGISLLGKNPVDAVGIGAKAAAQLSGADFDGDTVLVIPIKANKDGTKVNNIKADKARKELQEFDPKSEYKAYDGMPKVKSGQNGWDKQRQMGSVSNLITDMTLMGAPIEDIVKATKHSMVVIDAEKHNLDWRRSEKDNDIASLKKKYQGSERGGARTIISRASARYDIEQESFRFTIDPETGERTNLKTGATKMGRRKTGEVDEKGEPIYENTGKYEKVMQRSTKMKETDDARTLLSDPDNPYPKEVPYARYANQMKAMANEARKEYKALSAAKKDPSASKVYEDEVKSLTDKAYHLTVNAPRERQAQLRAANNFYKKKSEREDLDKDALKKLKSQCLSEARVACNAKGVKVEITPKEWEAIEHRAVSGTVVESLIEKADKASVMKYALPKADNSAISSAKQARIRAMARSGETTKDIADELGISPATVQKYITPGS